MAISILPDRTQMLNETMDELKALYADWLISNNFLKKKYAFEKGLIRQMYYIDKKTESEKKVMYSTIWEWLTKANISKYIDGRAYDGVPCTTNPVKKYNLREKCETKWMELNNPNLSTEEGQVFMENHYYEIDEFIIDIHQEIFAKSISELF